MLAGSMRFPSGEDVDALREATRRRAQSRLKPLAARIDADSDRPRGLRATTDALGLPGVTAPEAFGGAGARDRMTPAKTGRMGRRQE
ncbi:MAG: acyl-CoA dehydrogenase family protein [Pseudomonadota bacterium]|nr:acyl-CoA dehydrogenase family protein [Pseudomonadota bacterium]